MSIALPSRLPLCLCSFFAGTKFVGGRDNSRRCLPRNERRTVDLLENTIGSFARGLMAKPKLHLLDEPSLGLAPLIVQQVFQIIAGIRGQGTTVLLVEQNAHLALSIGDRGYVLETGRLVAEGNPEALWNNDEVRAAYLGGRNMEK